MEHPENQLSLAGPRGDHRERVPASGRSTVLQRPATSEMQPGHQSLIALGLNPTPNGGNSSDDVYEICM